VKTPFRTAWRSFCGVEPAPPFNFEGLHQSSHEQRNTKSDRPTLTTSPIPDDLIAFVFCSIYCTLSSLLIHLRRITSRTLLNDSFCTPVNIWRNPFCARRSTSNLQNFCCSVTFLLLTRVLTKIAPDRSNLTASFCALPLPRRLGRRRHEKPLRNIFGTWLRYSSTHPATIHLSHRHQSIVAILSLEYCVSIRSHGRLVRLQVYTKANENLFTFRLNSTLILTLSSIDPSSTNSTQWVSSRFSFQAASTRWQCWITTTTSGHENTCSNKHPARLRYKSAGSDIELRRPFSSVSGRHCMNPGTLSGLSTHAIRRIERKGYNI
jgi:hypothetical protein